MKKYNLNISVHEDNFSGLVESIFHIGGYVCSFESDENEIEILAKVMSKLKELY